MVSREYVMIIQMSDLNDERFGRFGNQLFKFFFLKIIHKEIDCEIRYPNWLGNLAFNLPESPEPLNCEDVLVIPPTSQNSLNDVLHLIREKIVTGSQIIEIKGFFQFHTNEYANYKNLFYETFIANPLLLDQITYAMDTVNPEKRDLVSIHVRRGDYTNYTNSEFFWTTPMHSIFESLTDLNLAKFDKKLTYICSDDMDYCASEFDKKNISFLCSDNFFSYSEESLRLLVDFLIMSMANVNIISNSSLSFFASMLNTKARIFLRPSPNKESLIPFDPWNSDVLISKNFS
jgi:hypothetical protein